MIWNIFNFFGKIGFFKYRGLSGHYPRWYPQGRVLYPDGMISAPMAIGNAWEYARIFRGKVIKV